ncbi:hypothetical protein LSUE1_G000647 [Lachnellula suecica]|uniref:DUF6546 domain-containing protein n=1 Tax=Lachnellula suecica TaxID=602035 RepID=A0A8T9CH63_9HELO|nr:hypothetical protein LSUE1_G000647 [Lachnellula suecica]
MIVWPKLPAEIRLAVLEALLQNGCSLASLATVSREWQALIEPHNFSRIKVAASRVVDLGSMLQRNRSLVRYIWFCLELQEYDCPECAPEDENTWGLSIADNLLIAAAFGDLFSTLSALGSGLFKYLTFEPDLDDASDSSMSSRKQSMLAKASVSEPHHGWAAGSRTFYPPDNAIDKVFEEIFDQGPFEDKLQEFQWWHQLPSVPAVTGLLLRQQNRRRWSPLALRPMFARLPRLQEIHYEHWREWGDEQQQETDDNFRLLFESLSSNRLRRLILFENFDQTYPASFGRHWDLDPVLIPCSSVSRAIAKASLALEHLFASFIVDASNFFNARELTWTWPNLTWLALTSRLLAPQESPTELDHMLRAAAAAALKMPNLRTMEIWRGETGLAAVFRYQRPEARNRPAVITCRGTGELTLRPLVHQAWDAVAPSHDGQGHVVVRELLDDDAINSHGMP